MNRKERRQYAKYNRQRPATLVELPQSEWPSHPKSLRRVWLSREFHVQLWDDDGFQRISVCRTSIQGDGGWVDAITWVDLQQLKAVIGYGDWWAVECFPPESEIVNVANMRHLFLLPEPPAFGWHSRTEDKR